MGGGGGEGGEAGGGREKKKEGQGFGSAPSFDLRTAIQIPALTNRRTQDEVKRLVYHFKLFIESKKEYERSRTTEKKDRRSGNLEQRGKEVDVVCMYVNLIERRGDVWPRFLRLVSRSVSGRRRRDEFLFGSSSSSSRAAGLLVWV